MERHTQCFSHWLGAEAGPPGILIGGYELSPLEKTALKAEMLLSSPSFPGSLLSCKGTFSIGSGSPHCPDCGGLSDSFWGTPGIGSPIRGSRPYLDGFIGHRPWQNMAAYRPHCSPPRQFLFSACALPFAPSEMLSKGKQEKLKQRQRNQWAVVPFCGLRQLQFLKTKILGVLRDIRSLGT